MVDIPVCNPGPADIHLSVDSQWHRVPVLIQDVNLCIINRLSDQDMPGIGDLGNG
ncbi:hypothetical protein D3C73_923220 [compost metagenome]